jgi:hypothetical protein
MYMLFHSQISAKKKPAEAGLIKSALPALRAIYYALPRPAGDDQLPVAIQA